MSASDQSVVMTRFTDEQKRDIREAVTRAMSICEIGFANRSSLGFVYLKEILGPHEKVHGIKQSLALCDADTISPGFAYPHIESLLRDVLSVMDSSS